MWLVYACILIPNPWFLTERYPLTLHHLLSEFLRKKKRIYARWTIMVSIGMELYSSFIVSVSEPAIAHHWLVSIESGWGALLLRQVERLFSSRDTPLTWSSLHMWRCHSLPPHSLCYKFSLPQEITITYLTESDFGPNYLSPIPSFPITLSNKTKSLYELRIQIQIQKIKP